VKELRSCQKFSDQTLKRITLRLSFVSLFVRKNRNRDKTFSTIIFDLDDFILLLMPEIFALDSQIPHPDIDSNTIWLKIIDFGRDETDKHLDIYACVQSSITRCYFRCSQQKVAEKNSAVQ
jgi:hypothetical protein